MIDLLIKKTSIATVAFVAALNFAPQAAYGNVQEEHAEGNLEIQTDIEAESDFTTSQVELTLSIGDDGEEVLKLQQNLKTLGFMIEKELNSIFDEITVEEVSQFQDYYALEVTGNADEATLAKIDEILSSPLQQGQRHNAAIELKEDLATIGYHISNNPTTLYGSLTTQKVSDFQTEYGLRVNGIADEVTLAKINQILTSPLREGQRHELAIKLKEDLSKLGYHISNNPTTLYGSITARKVKGFQKMYGLRVNGIAEEVTLAKIEELLNAPLAMGLRRNDVIDLKVNLDKIGFGVSNNPTIYYGPITERTVKEFQEYYGLDASGVASSETLTKINEVLASPLQEGRRHASAIKLKEDLAILGFHISNNPTNLYGSITTKVVSDFQKEYGLQVNGIADEITLAKIEKLLNEPMELGLYRNDVIQLKEDLDRLGFPISNNPTNYYGPITEQTVKEFQEYYGLEVTGVAGSEILEKMEEILNSSLSRGNRNDAAIQLKIDLEKLGYHVSDHPTTLYGQLTEQRVQEFQAYYGLRENGIADEVTLKLLSDMLTTTEYGYSVTDMVNIQLNQEPRTELYSQKIAYVASQYIEKNSDGVTGIVKSSEDLGVEQLNVRFEPNTLLGIIGTLNPGTAVNIIGKENDTDLNNDRTWYAIEFPHNERWQFARSADVKKNVDPNQFTLNVNHRDMYQFLVVSEAIGVSVDYLNYELQTKGVLKNTGQTFSDAAKENKVNEIYLLSHALLETSHGTSALSNGSIKVGILEDNKWISIQPNGSFIAEKNGDNWTIERVENFDESQATNLKSIYNMFGIGAKDSSPLTRGSIRAYEEGWYSPEEAVSGGVKFIAENYVHHPTLKQDTLYKMRWNPAQPGSDQYATDIRWSANLANMIYGHYQKLEVRNKSFDIPKFK